MTSTSTPRNLNKDVALLLLPVHVPPEYKTRLQEAHPGLEVRSLNTKTSDKILSPDDIPSHLYRDVTILCTQRLPDPDLVPECHYVQLTAAGPDKSVHHPLYKNPSITFCTTNGVHAPQIAEWVIGTWIAHQHHFSRYAAYQKDGYWPSNLERATSYVDDSHGLRMGVLGYGAIGRQCAVLGKAMGMEIIAYTLREKPTVESRRDDSYCVPGTGDPDGTIPSAWYHGASRESVNHFLAQDIDLLVMALPLTDSTVHILDEEQFDILSAKRTFVTNVGRGPHVNTTALISALNTGKVRGAALDVTNPEPLPQDHPLWKAPNVFITPHVSWQTPHYFTRVMDIFEQNLDRMKRGERLINEIDKSLNY